MAARTLEDMAAKGYTKATAKDEAIKRSWAAAKERCITNYAKLPFGPTRKANHAAAVRAATHRTPDSDTSWPQRLGEVENKLDCKNERVATSPSRGGCSHLPFFMCLSLIQYNVN